MGTSELWYIAGASRSGSTLLSHLLAHATGGFDAGELHLLWRSMTDGRLCTCGESVASCPFWSDVRKQVLDDTGLNLASVQAIERSIPRQRDLLIRSRLPMLHPSLVDLRRHTERAISQRIEGRALVDNSKLASVAWLALAIDRPVRVVHIVRDPRAVAHSKGHPHPDPSLGGRMMPSAGALRSGAQWLSGNLAIERIRRSAPAQVQRVRYEDLAENPHKQVHRLVGELLPKRGTAFASGDSHAIAGNPVRFSSARPVAVDVRWRTEMGRRQRIAVDAVTMPLCHRYGYGATAVTWRQNL